jgi:hypothetical protein
MSKSDRMEAATSCGPKIGVALGRSFFFVSARFLFVVPSAGVLSGAEGLDPLGLLALPSVRAIFGPQHGRTAPARQG